MFDSNGVGVVLDNSLSEIEAAVCAVSTGESLEIKEMYSVQIKGFELGELRSETECGQTKKFRKL